VISLQQIELVGAYPGEVRPRIESTLAFQVGGKLVQRRVQPGDPVKAGQVLARLDPQDLELAESAARAELAAADVERSRAAADLARFSQLRDSGFISKAEFDQRKAAHDAAVARVAQARASLRGQSNRAEYSVLQADADGVVTGVDAEIGQVVAAGQPVVRVARTAEKEVAFLIPEGRLQTVRQLGEAEVTLWTGGPALRATVREISATADPATRAFPARVQLHDAPESVQFGMTATVRFATPVEQPLAQVPLSALLREGDRTAVWILDPASMTVSRQPVDVQTMTDTQAVLGPGLPDGTEVVTAGVHLLRDGQKVNRLSHDGGDRHDPASPSAAAMLPLNPGSAARE
jgi:RND family efflux transporter MFP subunit